MFLFTFSQRGKQCGGIGVYSAFYFDIQKFLKQNLTEVGRNKVLQGVGVIDSQDLCVSTAILQIQICNMERTKKKAKNPKHSRSTDKQMIKSEFDINSMNLWIQPTLFQHFMLVVGM